MSKYIYNKNTKIYYKTFGEGPALVLVHGMGNKKELWEETGWVELLKDYFTVITVDLRGHGESTKHYDSSFYTTDAVISDINKVVDHLGFKEFNYFGHSYGATIGLLLCKHNNNINKCICAGSTFGGKFFKETIPEWIKYYKELESMKKNNRFDTTLISFDDIAWLKKTDISVLIYQMEAWTKWIGVNISDIHSPLAVYSGTNDSKNVIENFKENEDKFIENNIKYTIFEGLSHTELVSKIDVVSPYVLDFLLK